MQVILPRSRKKWWWLLAIPGLLILVTVGYKTLYYAVGWGAWPWQLKPITGTSPQFITHQYIDLDRITQVSKFRSGVGHDASDSFESCRSMKHYFAGNENEDRTTIELYAPADGTIALTLPDGPGNQVWIRPTDYPQYLIIIYHATLNPGLGTGSSISSGDPIGHLGGQASWSDIQVAQLGFFKQRFVSYFDVMTDTVFAEFTALGFSHRDQFIFSKAERDQDPFRCGWGFDKTGRFITEQSFDEAYVTLRPAAGPAEGPHIILDQTLTITMERSACFGTCPSYSITIHGNGAVEYIGHAYVAVEGMRTKQLSAGEVQALIDAFNLARFYSFKDEYTAPITDLPTTTITLTQAGSSKKVIDYYGAPPALKTLETTIDTVVGTQAWTGQQP